MNVSVYSWMVTYFPSHKPFNFDEQDIQDTASEDKQISEVLLWTPTRGHTNNGWQVKIYIN